jgi:hypothetical protein
MLPLTYILFPFLALYYLLGEQASLLVARIPIHSCPWSADNCPPFSSLPLLTHPHMSSYNIYCLLPHRGIHEIKRMYLTSRTHGLFIT